MTLREKMLKATDDFKKSIKAGFQVRKDQKSLESWVIDREAEVAELELKISDFKAATTLDVDQILDKTDELELAKRRLKQGEALLKELFVDTEPEGNE
jgi:hypothetical protein